MAHGFFSEETCRSQLAECGNLAAATVQERITDFSGERPREDDQILIIVDFGRR